MTEDTIEETPDNKITFKGCRDIAVYLFAAILFFGTWIEVAINTGLIGAVLGWFPGAALAWAWLAVTGRL